MIRKPVKKGLKKDKAAYVNPIAHSYPCPHPRLDEWWSSGLFPGNKPPDDISKSYLDNPLENRKPNTQLHSLRHPWGLLSDIPGDCSSQKCIAIFLQALSMLWFVRWKRASLLSYCSYVSFLQLTGSLKQPFKKAFHDWNPRLPYQ